MEDRREARGTRERLLDAGQRMFGEHGLEGTSLRAVTAEAGTNLAAVNYHFGSKEALFRAVIQRVMQPVTDEHRRRLEELGENPSVEELLDAFVGPFVRMISGQKDRSLARLVNRVITETDDEVRSRVFEQTRRSDEAYLEAFAHALPHLPRDEFVWRFYAVLGTVTFQLVGAAGMEFLGKEPPFGKPSSAPEEMRARIVTFLAAGLRAPATGKPGSGAGS